LIEAAAGDHLSVEIHQEMLRKVYYGGLLQYSPRTSGKEESDEGRVENLRGLCPIKAALGLEEITRSLNGRRHHQGKTNPQDLLFFAVNDNSCAALDLLLTAWSPSSYLHHIPESSRVHGVGPWVPDKVMCLHGCLHEAARRRNIEMVETLINAGASIYGRNGEGRNPYEMLCARDSKFSRVTDPVLFNLLGWGKRVV
jgi:hypothetical protein